MPHSIAELKSGLASGAFELGSHGMVHMRNTSDRRPESRSDHREFLDLDESETENHIKVSKDEIARVFGVEPQFFVAPVWAYRPGVTKATAAAHFGVVVDCTQHVESGACPPFGERDPETAQPSYAETFRPGARLFNFTNPDFWRCYSQAGIPVHYMQHGDVSRDQLLWVVRGMASCENDLPDGALRHLLLTMNSARKPAYQRAGAAFLVAATAAGPRRAAELFLTEAMCNVYRIMDAALKAGYRCVAASRLRQELVSPIG
jgi:peptidoglycan/xylan/chitin deacetylase (PgdA/CDA1 family)